MSARARPTVCIALLLLGGTSVSAQLSKPERRQARSMFDGTLYMRLDAPCEKGRHPFGVYYSPVVDISPTSSAEDEAGFSAGWYHMGGTQLTVRINDPVVLDELDFDEDRIEVELEGIGPAADEHTNIRFVDIHGIDDFQRAFDRAFARVPLQEEHPDWPAEIRKAIAQRQLVDGMTKRQAYYVTGTPERFDRSEENGKEIEIWTLRDTARVKVGYFRTRLDTNNAPPRTIRFEDGLLVGAEDSGGRNEFSLDD